MRFARPLSFPYNTAMNPEAIDTIRTWLGNGSINVFGRPFAGKDTQGRKLADVFDGALLGGGEILRGSTIPPHVDAALRRGELIPSDDYISIVLPYLSKPEFANRPLILSSVGRWAGEETGVMGALTAANHPLKAVVYLELEENVVQERWLALENHDDRGGRYDDTADILAVRLGEFRDKTLPVLQAYSEQGLLERINAEGTPDEIYQRIIERLLMRAERVD